MYKHCFSQVPWEERDTMRIYSVGIQYKKAIQIKDRRERGAKPLPSGSTEPHGSRNKECSSQGRDSELGPATRLHGMSQGRAHCTSARKKETLLRVPPPSVARPKQCVQPLFWASSRRCFTPWVREGAATAGRHFPDSYSRQLQDVRCLLSSKR